jgi:hypothetical protein
VDQAYHHHPLLAESLIKQVDETVAGFEGGGFDPFLLAQDIPQNFSVDPGVMAGTAVVHLQFGPDSVQHLLVTMDGTGHEIAAIAEDEGVSGTALPTDSADSDSDATRPVFLSNEYRFSISYPVGWVLMAKQMDRPGSTSPG